MQEFKVALNLLNAAKSEVQRHDANTSTTRLNKLIDNEILLTQATQTLHEWPKKPIDHESIITKCKLALKSGNGNDINPPRTEILPSCAAVLINSNEAADLIRIDRRFPSSELFSAIAAIILEIEQHKATASKKVFRDAWDLIAPMFANGGHSSSSNNRRGHSSSQHNTDMGNTKLIFFSIQFVKLYLHFELNLILVDDSNDAVDVGDRKNADEQSSNQDAPMQFDENVVAGGMQDDSNHTSNTNGNGNGGSRAIDVDEADNHVSSNTNNEREKTNPFSRNRSNFSSGNDCSGGYGMHRESPAVIVNTNLLPFIQKLHDTMRKLIIFL